MAATTTRREFLALAGLGLASLYLRAQGVLEDPAPRTVYVTIDDGPRMVPEILGKLRNEDKVTFFCLGSLLATASGDEMVREALDRGHEVGNHCYSHRACSFTNEERYRSEILKTHELVEQAYSRAGRPNPRLFRFPYGDPCHEVVNGVARGSTERRAAIAAYLKELGYTSYLWDADSEDWRYYTGSRSLESVVRSATSVPDNGIVLIHELGISVKNVLPAFTNERYLLKALPR